MPQSITIKEILNSKNNLSIANKTGNTPWHVAYLHRDLNTINELCSCATINGNFNTRHEQLNSRNHNQEKPKENELLYATLRQSEWKNLSTKNHTHTTSHFSNAGSTDTTANKHNINGYQNTNSPI